MPILGGGFGLLPLITILRSLNRHTAEEGWMHSWAVPSIPTSRGISLLGYKISCPVLEIRESHPSIARTPQRARGGVAPGGQTLEAQLAVARAIRSSSALSWSLLCTSSTSLIVSLSKPISPNRDISCRNSRAYGTECCINIKMQNWKGNKNVIIYTQLHFVSNMYDFLFHYHKRTCNKQCPEWALSSKKKKKKIQEA